MIVIVADRQDLTASALVARWAAHGAGLLTCDDLSEAGWRFAPADPAASTAVVGGRVVAIDGISGVLTRLPEVSEQALAHIDPADRAYVAAELQAFLVAWLAALPCPVLNRPTPPGLAGPSWPHEKWVQTAARLGIPVAPTRRAALAASPTPPAAAPTAGGVTVTIVGHRHFGPVTPALARQAHALAEAAGVGLLAVRFNGATPGSYFLGASLWPDVSTDEVASALLDHFRGGSVRSAEAVGDP